VTTGGPFNLWAFGDAHVGSDLRRIAPGPLSHCFIWLKCHPEWSSL